jgi:hypothetical protein
VPVLSVKMKTVTAYLVQKGRQKWYRERVVDYLDLMKKGQECVCCGQTPVNYDHILPQEYHPYGKMRKGMRGNSPQTLTDFENGVTQFLCRSCNNSKGDSDTCRIHQKYLGIWNHLPKLDDMENPN